jgi:hypothetical protein
VGKKKKISPLQRNCFIDIFGESPVTPDPKLTTSKKKAKSL